MEKRALSAETNEEDKIVVIGNSKIRLADAISYITGRTNKLVFVEEGTGNKREMRIPYIPLIIFGELSERFGQGEITTVSALGGAYKMQLLNETDKSIGFPGAIGIRTSFDGDGTTFALWSIAPKGDPCNVFESRPLMELYAGAENAGVWAYGKGQFLSENIRARFSIEGILIKGINIPALRLLALVLYRVRQLVLDPDLKANRFWEADKYPGDYTEPDD